jgi:NADH-quinone oxidoreductase subunit L
MDFETLTINLAYLVPLFPLGAFLCIVFVTRFFKGSKISAYVSIFFNLVSFFFSCGILASLLKLVHDGSYTKPIEHTLTWIQLPSALNIPALHLEVGVLLDPLSSIVAFMVTLVSTLIMIYSIGYMEEDPGFSTFFAYMSLFVASMLTLTLSNNFLLTFVGWELVGLCSYLLIGFWFKKPSAARAAIKAFVVTRTGDVGFLIGIILLYWKADSLNFVQLSTMNFVQILPGALLWLVPLLIFCGAVGKSAQFPLHVWLPDAMEGPTPVSALIHAATMVAAGVYLVARSYFLFAVSPIALLVVAWIGAFTAFLAATMAMVQWDIKRSLAYSTVSQLGYMMLGLGIGPIGFVAAIFHLLTHAFFKALLFLGAGSVSHPFHEEENPFDMHHYGGLARKMPHTYWTFLFATLAITGCPLFAGFFSKDAILGAAFQSEVPTHYLLWGIALFTAFLTAVYMFRMLFLTFHGTKEGDHHVHESPFVMIFPLMVLALFALGGGWFGSPWFNWIGNFFVPYAKFYHVPLEIGVDWMGWGIGTAVFLIGLGTAWVFYGNGLKYASWVEHPMVKPFYTLFANKWYMDDFWTLVLRFFGFGFATAASWFDTNIIDGTVRGIGMLIGWIGIKIRAIQTGFAQQYAFVIYLAVLIFVIIFAHIEGYPWLPHF